MSKKLPTETMLVLIHGDVNIPLKDICEKYLGLTEEQAKRQATARFNCKSKSTKLPLPAFRIGSGQKAPWLVRASDLAKHVDEVYAESLSVEA